MAPAIPSVIVVTSGLGDDQAPALHLINQPVFLIDALRPPTRQLPSQRLGLAGAAKRIAPCFLDQAQQALRQFRIGLHPELQILEGLRLKFQAHPSGLPRIRKRGARHQGLRWLPANAPHSSWNPSNDPWHPRMQGVGGQASC